MGNIKFFLLAMLLVGTVGSSNVWAQHGHNEGGHDGGSHDGGSHGGHDGNHFGVVFSVPAYWPYYTAPYSYYPYTYPYYPYPYSYPPAIAVQTAPPVYIERGQESTDAEFYWYFCNDPKGYYPYVKQCKKNWQRVTPIPPGN